MNQTPSLFAHNISVLGTDIEANMKSQTRFEFGTGYGKAHFLRTANEAIGFLNALQDVMDGVYGILEDGFHAKFTWDTLALETEGIDRAYANFDMITKPEIFARLKEYGIEKLPGKVGWLQIDTNWGRLIPGQYARPRTSTGMIVNELPNNYAQLSVDEQHDARKAAKSAIHPDAFKNNEHAWAIVHKHIGVSLVQRLAKNSLRVVLDVQTGFEWQYGVILKKFGQLFGDKALRREARAETISKLNNQHYANVGAFLVEKSESFAFEADSVTSDGVLFLNDAGERVSVKATDLIGKRITYVIGDAVRAGFEYMSNLNMVKAAALRAARNEGWIITFWKAAE